MPLDENGKRIDISKRVELSNCSYEFLAPENYISRPPMPCTYLFVVDISQRSNETGFLETIVETIQALIESQQFQGLPRTDIGLIAFDTSLHFISILETPVIYTITEDLAEIDLPAPKNEFLCNFEDCSKNMILGLEQIKTLPVAPQATAYKHALKAAFLLLKDQGGKILIFQSDTHLEAGHPKEIQLSSAPSFYKDFANDMNLHNISCDVFISASQYCNLFALAEVTKYTGGDAFYYPHFTKKQGQEKLQNEI